MKRRPKLKTQGQATTVDENDPFNSQSKLEYLRGPAGEHDRQTIWKGGRGTLGCGEGGFVEGWLDK